MTIYVRCPKCASESAWYESDYRDTLLHCLCGYLKVVSTRLERAIIIEHPDAEDEVSLPRRESKLYVCLVALVGLREATTGEIAGVLNFGKGRRGRQSNSDVASQLTVLRYKGLVRVGIERKGVEGGSTWELTLPTLRLFKVMR